MATYFVDTSALIKLYVVEVGTNSVREILESRHSDEFFIAAVTQVEFVAGIVRRQSGNSINASVANDILSQFETGLRTDVDIVDVNDMVINRAVQFARKYKLRGYDAVQLSCASYINDLKIISGAEPVILLSADTELNAAAEAEGLVVINPV